jgi:hypothetical protein
MPLAPKFETGLLWSGGPVRTSKLLSSVIAVIFLAVSSLPAADDLSSAMKQILDHRTGAFSSIRKDPRGSGDDTMYTSTISLPGTTECYISKNEKTGLTDSCDVVETKKRAILVAQYKKYIKALRDATPPSWITWTVTTTEPTGEQTYIGPDNTHPAATVKWALEGMNKNFYELTVTFYADGYAMEKSK